MGQQQLLLLILGVIVVAVSTLAGIIAFDQNRIKSNGDQLVVDGIRIATDAQAWFYKGTSHGGGSGSFEGLSLERIGWRTNGDGEYENSYGTWSIPPASIERGRFLLEGTAVGDPPFNTICVRVLGSTPNDIAAELNPETCSLD